MNKKNRYTWWLTLSLFLFVQLFFAGIAYSAEKTIGTKSSQITKGPKTFVFDPRGLTWKLYGSNGNLIRSGRAVGGKRHCADVHRPCMTPTGSFRIYHKEGPNFRSSKYPLPHGGASMPWAMFFHKGYAIHGSNEMPNRPASHGCIRVYPKDARWLSSNLPVGTKVVVHSY